MNSPEDIREKLMVGPDVDIGNINYLVYATGLLKMQRDRSVPANKKNS